MLGTGGLQTALTSALVYRVSAMVIQLNVIALTATAWFVVINFTFYNTLAITIRSRFVVCWCDELCILYYAQKI